MVLVFELIALAALLFVVGYAFTLYLRGRTARLAVIKYAGVKKGDAFDRAMFCRRCRQQLRYVLDSSAFDAESGAAISGREIKECPDHFYGDTDHTYMTRPITKALTQ